MRNVSQREAGGTVFQSPEPYSGEFGSVLSVLGDGVLAAPSNFDLLRSDFIRQGPDLVLDAPDGSRVLVQDFFGASAGAAGVFVTGSGARIDFELARKLAQGSDGMQLAQVSGSDIGANSIGSVEVLEGQVFATRASGLRVALKVGDPIFQGDVIESAADGNVGFIFDDNSTMSLAESGRMVLDEFVYDPAQQSGSSSTSVVQGVFSFVSGQIAKSGAEAMVVSTPVATIGIRGTTVAGRAAQVGENNSISLLRDADGGVGEITVSNGAGSQILSAVGQTVSLSSFTQAPPPPIVLPETVIQQQFARALSARPEPRSAVEQQRREAEVREQNNAQESVPAAEENAPPDQEGEASPEGEDAPGDTPPDGEVPPEGEGAPGDTPPDGEVPPEGEGAPGDASPDGEVPPEGAPGDVPLEDEAAPEESAPSDVEPGEALPGEGASEGGAVGEAAPEGAPSDIESGEAAPGDGSIGAAPSEPAPDSPGGPDEGPPTEFAGPDGVPGEFGPGPDGPPGEFAGPAGVPGEFGPGPDGPPGEFAGPAGVPGEFGPGPDVAAVDDPGFGGPGFGDPGFADPGFGGPGFGDPGFGVPAFGSPTFIGPGFDFLAPGITGPDFDFGPIFSPVFGDPFFGSITDIDDFIVSDPTDSRPEAVSDFSGLSIAEIEAIAASEDIFLKGAFLELGISKGGTFGTITDAPAGFHETSSQGGSLGFVVDLDGFDVGASTSPPLSGDFINPGDPEDSFTLGFTKDGVNVTKSNAFANRSTFELVTATTDVSGSENTVRSTGTTEGLSFEQQISFSANDTFFTTSITIVNNNSSSVSNVRYLRSFDPDQDLDTHDTFNTLNDAFNETLFSNVSGASAKGPTSGIQVNLVSTEGGAVGSNFGFTNRNPFEASAFDAPVDNNFASGDIAITLNLDFGTLEPGQSVTKSFVTSFQVRSMSGDASLNSNDFVVLTDGADTWDAGQGNDTVLDFLGNDIIDLGSGNDTLIADANVNSGVSTSNQYDGGTGIDTLDYSNASGDLTFTQTASANKWIITETGAANRSDTVKAFETIIGTTGNDTFVTNSSSGSNSHSIAGDLGADTISLNSTIADNIYYQRKQDGEIVATNRSDNSSHLGDTVNGFVTGFHSIQVSHSGFNISQSSIIENINFEIINVSFDGTNAISSEFSSGNSAFIYSSADDILYFDENGNADGFSVMFENTSSTSLSADDFTLVA